MINRFILELIGNSIIRGDSSSIECYVIVCKSIICNIIVVVVTLKSRFEGFIREAR